MEIGQRIGQRIRTARKHAGLTQKQLAEYLGKSGAAVAYLEQGKRRANAEVLMQVSEATSRPLAFFYEEETPQENTFSSRMDVLQREVYEIQKLLQSEQEKRKVAEGDVHLFRELFDHTNDHLVVWNAETGQAITCNQKVLDEMDCTREEFLQKTIMEVETGIPSLVMWQKVVEDLKRNGATIMKTEPRRKDGSIFFLEVSAKYVCLDDVSYIVTAARNISERAFHTAEGEDQYLQQYRKLFESLSFPVMSCDRLGKVFKVNAAFRETFTHLGESFHLSELSMSRSEAFEQSIRSAGLSGKSLESRISFDIEGRQCEFSVRIQPFIERSYITQVLVLFQPAV